MEILGGPVHQYAAPLHPWQPDCKRVSCNLVSFPTMEDTRSSFSMPKSLLPFLVVVAGNWFIVFTTFGMIIRIEYYIMIFVCLGSMAQLPTELSLSIHKDFLRSTNQLQWCCLPRWCRRFGLHLPSLRKLSVPGPKDAMAGSGKAWYSSSMLNPNAMVDCLQFSGLHHSFCLLLVTMSH